MNSINFLTQNPAFKLNGTTSISSKVGLITVLLILATSLSLCYPIIDNMWTSYNNLYVSYSEVQGTSYSINSFPLAFQLQKGINGSQINLSQGGKTQQQSQCQNRQQSIICFQIKQSSFNESINYTIQNLPSNITILFPISHYNNENNIKEYQTISINLNPNQSLTITLQKYLIIIDDSLFQFQPYTQQSGISNISYSISPSNETQISLQSSKQQMKVLMFKREKMSLVFGKVIVCFQFLFTLSSILLIIPYHRMKYKLEVAKQTIQDPILNTYKINIRNIILLILYCSFSVRIRKILTHLFPREITYISLIIIPEFDKKLSIDQINIEKSEQDIQLQTLINNKNRKRKFKKLITDNYLDDEEQDVEEVQRRLNYVDRQLQSINKQPFDIWFYLHNFDISGVPIQFESQQLKQKQSQTKGYQNGNDDDDEMSKRKINKSIVLNTVAVVCLIVVFLSFFVNDIIEYVKSSQQIQTYTTFYDSISYELKQFMIISNASYQIKGEVYSNNQLLRQVPLICQDEKYECKFSTLLYSSLNQNHVLKILINTTQNVLLHASTHQLLTYSIINKTFQQLLSPGQSTLLNLHLVSQQTVYESKHHLSYPHKILSTPSPTPNTIQITLSLHPKVQVRKITYNGFYTIIKNSWSILRLIIVTMIFQLIINPIRKKNSTVAFLKKHQEDSSYSQSDNQNENILDIVAVLNFINTKIQKKRKEINISDDTSVSSGG